MSWQDWLLAFGLTQLIEVPIWLVAAWRLSIPRRLLIAFGASTITHPILWFAFPWESWPYVPTLLLGEGFVIVVEALFAKSLGLRDAWLWSIFANATSVAIGALIF